MSVWRGAILQWSLTDVIYFKWRKLSGDNISSYSYGVVTFVTDLDHRERTPAGLMQRRWETSVDIDTARIRTHVHSLTHVLPNYVKCRRRRDDTRESVTTCKRRVGLVESLAAVCRPIFQSRRHLRGVASCCGVDDERAQFVFVICARPMPTQRVWWGWISQRNYLSLNCC